MAPMSDRADLAHKAIAPRSIRCFVLTVSDTRTEDTDASGVTFRVTAMDHLRSMAVCVSGPERVTSSRVMANQIGLPALQAPKRSMPKVLMATTAMLSFISFWRAAAVVLNSSTSFPATS